MAVFPRLRDVFGVPVDEIDAAAIERAVKSRAPESEQLDWKRDPYKRGDDVASDIAGMANAGGGVIVLGVDEDKHGRAAAATPFADSIDVVARMVTEIRQRRIRPFVTDLTVTPVEARDGRHFMVIAVGRSFDAPHAVMPESPNAKHMAFPVRQMTTTAWLKEDQVAAMYRNRFAAHADVAGAVDALMTNHSKLVQGREEHWVSLAVAPTIPGARAPGVIARTAEVGFALGWAAHRAPPGSNFDLDPNMLVRQVRPAVGATMVMFHEATLRLGHSGSGFITQLVPRLDARHDVDMTTPMSNNGGRNTVWASTDEVEWALFTSLSYAVDHAVDTGATGDLEIRAKLQVNSVGGLACYYPRAVGGRAHRVPDTALILQHTAAVSATIGISDGAYYRATAAATYLLATDILAEFGIDEPRLFTYDGWVNTGHFGPTLRELGAAEWATEHVNGDTPPGHSLRPSTVATPAD